jgi:hypothetical protein
VKIDAKAGWVLGRAKDIDKALLCAIVANELHGLFTDILFMDWVADCCVLHGRRFGCPLSGLKRVLVKFRAAGVGVPRVSSKQEASDATNRTRITAAGPRDV